MQPREVLNKIFKEAKYASFVRKLHRWGFVRLTSGTGTDCFHHPLFQRNKKEMAGKITCTPRGEKDKERSSERVLKPPSLAGVEKFIKRPHVLCRGLQLTLLLPLLLSEEKAEEEEEEEKDSPRLRDF